jgi:hypothetical protein
MRKDPFRSSIHEVLAALFFTGLNGEMFVKLEKELPA